MKYHFSNEYGETFLYVQNGHYTEAFVFQRSDAGDGGWSIHQINSGVDDDPIVSGPSTMDDGEWSRPDTKDVRTALDLYEGNVRGVTLA